MLKMPLSTKGSTPEPPDGELTVFTMSDSSGETAHAVARAAVVQFPSNQATVYRLPRVKSVEQISALVKQVASRHGVIAYTLVLPELRKELETQAASHHVSAVDLLSPLMTAISSATGTASISQPGRLHVMDESYFRRIAAMDFAIRFDDGKNLEGVLQADIVLVGVSRTSKTPNSIYLAHHYGLKAANVPLVLDIEPPVQLFEVAAKKIIGLDIDPILLQEIRIARSHILGMPFGMYVDPERIAQEVEYARKIFRQLECHIIDVSAKAIEETSSEIFMYLQNNKEQ